MRLLLIQKGPPLSDAPGATRTLDLTGYNAVVLDRTLPDQCGLTWLRKQRGAGLTPGPFSSALAAWA